MKMWSTGRKWTLAGGIALCISAFLVDAVGIGSVGFGILEILLFGVGMLCVLGAILAGRMLSLYRESAVILLNLVLMVVLIELGARVVYTLGNVTETPQQTTLDALMAQPYYADKAWGQSYWREDASLNLFYYPYTLWRRKAFQGTQITLQADGTRLVPNTACEDKEAYQVWVFGGSTVWGTGSPDWGTIPAYLQATLDAQTERPVCVRNYGQPAYVATQNWIELTHLLLTERPDAVIFYNGINEAGASYESGQAGIHRNFTDIQARFEGTTEKPLLAQLLAPTFTYRVIEEAFIAPRRTVIAQNYVTFGAEEAPLARATVEHYLGVHRHVEALANQYGFEFAFFWQPYITVCQKTLTPAEQYWYDDIPELQHAFIKATWSEMTNVLQANTPLHFYDIAAVLDDVPADEQVWIDGMHITPEGNQRVAQAIFERMAWEGLNQ